MRMSRWARKGSRAFAAIFLLWHAASSAAATFSEDAVEAAYLYRFAAYVEWPEHSGSETSFGIGVVDAEGVANELDKLLPGLLVQQRPARVVRVQAAGDLPAVQILYVGAASRHRALIAAAAHRPILVVLDHSDGLSLGAVINFVHVGHNLRFEVSLPAAARSGLKIDSGLLSVAERVERGPQAEITCAPLSAPRPSACGYRIALRAGIAAAPVAADSRSSSRILGEQ